MLVNGIELNFDITSPSDVLRYKAAGERMEAEGAKIAMPSLQPDDPNFLNTYVDMLNAQLRLFGDFLDEVFGGGVAQQLLGTTPA